MIQFTKCCGWFGSGTLYIHSKLNSICLCHPSTDELSESWLFRECLSELSVLCLVKVSTASRRVGDEWKREKLIYDHLHDVTVAANLSVQAKQFTFIRVNPSSRPSPVLFSSDSSPGRQGGRHSIDWSHYLCIRSCRPFGWINSSLGFN